MANSKLEFHKPTIKDYFQSAAFKNLVLLLAFALIFTLLLSSKHFFFRSLIDENGIARRDVFAERTVEVIDTQKTEQRKKELAQKLDPIMRPAEDMFILNDFDNLVASMQAIKSSDDTYQSKHNKIVELFDLQNTDR